MSAKAIREATGKTILNSALAKCPHFSPCRFASVDEDSLGDGLLNNNAWLTSTPLVVKPDQLIKRRGKLGLIKVNVDFPGVKQWLSEFMLKEIKVPINAWFNNFISSVFFNVIVLLLYVLTVTNGIAQGTRKENDIS